MERPELLHNSARPALHMRMQQTQMQPWHCGRMRALRCQTTMPRRSSHIWVTSTRTCALRQLMAWLLQSRCDACALKHAALCTNVLLQQSHKGAALRIMHAAGAPQ